MKKMACLCSLNNFLFIDHLKELLCGARKKFLSDFCNWCFALVLKVP